MQSAGHISHAAVRRKLLTLGKWLVAPKTSVEKFSREGLMHLMRWAGIILFPVLEFLMKEVCGRWSGEGVGSGSRCRAGAHSCEKPQEWGTRLSRRVTGMAVAIHETQTIFVRATSFA